MLWYEINPEISGLDSLLTGSLFSLASCPFAMIPIVLGNSLAFLYNKMFQSHLVQLLFQTQISYSFKEVLVRFKEERSLENKMLSLPS